MKRNNRKIEESVIVITGASSGLGRQTALQCAERGASVVLAARNSEALQELVTQCRRLGGKAFAVPTDVADVAAVQSLAREAVSQYGQIDIWMNNAGVMLYAKFEDAPLEDMRRVIDVNLFGAVHGARAVLPFFRKQERGHLINVASILGHQALPYLSAYSMSKHALIGLSSSLRQELSSFPDIHISTVVPGAIDTPIYQHAANYTGKAIKAPSPVIDVKVVADALVSLMESPRRELVLGGGGRLVTFAGTVLPELSERITARTAEQANFMGRATPPTRGNLVDATRDQVQPSGGWQEYKKSS